MKSCYVWNYNNIIKIVIVINIPNCQSRWGNLQNPFVRLFLVKDIPRYLLEISTGKEQRRWQLSGNRVLVLTGFLTGHYQLEKHMGRLSLKQNSDCKCWGIKDGSLEHFTPYFIAITELSANNLNLRRDWRRPDTFSETIKNCGEQVWSNWNMIYNIVCGCLH